MSIIMHLCRSLRTIGFARTFQAAFSAFEDTRFDRKYGVDAIDWHKLATNDVKGVNLTHAVDYEPTRVRALIRTLPLPTNGVFVAVGSGKCRVLLLAAQFGFKRVVRIEFSDHLNRIAEENISRYRKRKHIPYTIEVINTDIAECKPTHNENVLFLYNPFDAVVMNKFVELLSSSIEQNKRLIWLILHRFLELDLDLKFIEETFFKAPEIAHETANFDVYLSQPRASRQ